MQRTNLAAVAVGLIAFLAAGGRPARAAEPVNILPGGGFEEGLTGWTADPQQTLLADPRQARSGQACLTAELAAPDRALKLIRRIPVRADRRYEFEVYARATGDVRLALYYYQPKSDVRQRAMVWDKLTPRWQRYAAEVSAGADGTLTLEIIAPSTFGGAAGGRIWIDDLALYETAKPAVIDVSAGAGFNDEPAMARADDGSIYVAWVSFRDGADTLQVARFRPQDKGLAREGAWQVVGGKDTYVLGPALVAAGQKVVLLYAAEVNRNWDIYAVECGPQGPGRPAAVGAHPAADIKPAGAWHGGTLHVAWESSRGGSRQVFAARLAGGKASEAEVLSPAGVSSYAPSVAALASGEVAVAWHSFREHNYDIYLCRRAAAGTWGPETRLTKAPTIDRHATLLARGGELWLVYENAQINQYRIGATVGRHLMVAQVTPDGLQAPVLAQAKPPLQDWSEAPAAAFDADGRLWLAYLVGQNRAWETRLICLAGDRWLAPVTVGGPRRLDRRPGLVLDGGRAIVCHQADTLTTWPDEKQATEQAACNVLLSVMDTGSPPPPAPLKLARLAESAEAFEVAALRAARGEDSAPSSITYQGRTLRLFYGDLHEHTDVSQCNRTGDQTIDESYQHMRDIAVHDFACATDHGYNQCPYLWNYTAKLARTNDDPGRFLTFLAEEWTSTFEEYSEKHPYGFYGHRNLVFADPYFPRWWNARNRQTPAQVWEDLRKMNANFVHIPHQLADTGNVPTDWDFTDEKAQPVAEIFQTRGSYEYKGTPREAKRTVPQPGHFLQDAWARGIVIGVIASPDHGGGYGKACVFAPELKREAILDALRARRCYGTTAAKIFLDVRVAGRLMGEKVAAPAPRPVPLEIRVRCPADIDRIEVCRNNQFIHCHKPEGKACDLAFSDRDPLPGRSYYYVRVVQKDEEIAWSSPVWFGAE